MSGRKFTFEGQPAIGLLTHEDIERVHAGALKLLAEVGVEVHSERALKLLAEAGAQVDFESRRVKFPERLVEWAIEAAPSQVTLYSRDGDKTYRLEGDRVHYTPGSATLKLLESDGRTVRKPTAADFEDFSLLVEGLEYITLQSTAMVLDDVPREVSDSYRLFVILRHGVKPTITGAFSIHGVKDMYRLLAAAVGGEEELRGRPRAVFDVCPSPPLKWAEIGAENIIDLARLGVPVEFISMPLAGSAAPATLAGSVLQHTVETLSGLVLAQVAREGAAVIYGGAPSLFDMRTGTTPLAAIETTMIDIAFAQMGKYYGLPTNASTGLTDSKLLDVQAGLETSVGMLLGTLAGINVITGPGIVEFATSQSLEKLAMDNDLCGSLARLRRGMTVNEETMAAELIAEVGPGGEFLTARHTRKWYKLEQFFPSQIIDRWTRNSWSNRGSKDSIANAREVVAGILERRDEVAKPLDDARAQALLEAMNEIAQEQGLDPKSLPINRRG